MDLHFGLGARLLRRDIHGDDILATLDQRFENRVAERLLPMNDDTHGKYALPASDFCEEEETTLPRPSCPAR